MATQCGHKQREHGNDQNDAGWHHVTSTDKISKERIAGGCGRPFPHSNHGNKNNVEERRKTEKQ